MDAVLDVLQEVSDPARTSDPRAEVIARLSADLALLTRTGDMEGVMLIHETIARLLRR